MVVSYDPDAANRAARIAGANLFLPWYKLPFLSRNKVVKWGHATQGS
jgi:hypothetical protein